MNCNTHKYFLCLIPRRFDRKSKNIARHIFVASEAGRWTAQTIGRCVSWGLRNYIYFTNKKYIFHLLCNAFWKICKMHFVMHFEFIKKDLHTSRHSFENLNFFKITFTILQYYNITLRNNFINILLYLLLRNL